MHDNQIRTLALIVLGWPHPIDASRKALIGKSVDISPNYEPCIDVLVQGRRVKSVILRTALALILLGRKNPKRIAKDALLGNITVTNDPFVSRLATHDF